MRLTILLSCRLLHMLALLVVPQAVSAQTCGDLSNGYGPFDYRSERGQPLWLVESAHFTRPVEMLLHGATATTPGHDLDYTLRAFPNHHRALLAATSLAEKTNTDRPDGMNYTIECYYDRALRFRPDDLTVRQLFARLLFKKKAVKEALAQLDYAATQAGDNPFTHYNVGLNYFEFGEYAKALKQAHAALALGFPRTDLREKLRAAGKWSEPPLETASPAASSASGN